MKKNQLKILSFTLIFAIFSTLVFTGVESYAAATTTSPINQAGKLNLPNKQVTPKLPDRTQKMKEALKTNNPSKFGVKKVLFKFFLAMLGVLVSAFAIFMGLKLYKKIILKNNSASDNINYNNSLESPKDFKEAINIFLDKTDK